MAFKPESPFTKHELFAGAGRPDKGRTIANYDHWFHAMARKGIGAANRGDFAPESEVDRRFSAMLNSADSKTVTG